VTDAESTRWTTARILFSFEGRTTRDGTSRRSLEDILSYLTVTHECRMSLS
jgi:hypothetical protein